MLFATFLLMLVLVEMAVAVGLLSYNAQTGGKSRLMDQQALYLAEAGLQKARQRLVSGGQAVGWGESDVAFGAGTYTVTTTDNGNGTYTLTAQGYVPNRTTPAAQRELTERNIVVTTSNGTNLSLTATASASSSRGGDTPDRAKDGDLGTIWRSDTNGSGSWLEMDYGSSTSLSKIIIQEDNNIDGLTIEWSDNNSSWTVASGLTVVESPSKTWTATFTATSHRYFRSRFTDVPADSPARVKEMESYNASVSLGTGTYSTQW